MKIDVGLWMATGLMIVIGLVGVLAVWTEIDRVSKLTPEQYQAEQRAREEEYKDRRKDDSVFCAPCVGPHIGMDGKLRYGISPFGVNLF